MKRFQRQALKITCPFAGEVKAENKIYIDSMDLARPSRFLLPLISNKRSGQEAGKILLEV